MAEAVELVVVAEVGEALVQAPDDVVGVQVAVAALGGGDEVYGFARQGAELANFIFNFRRRSGARRRARAGFLPPAFPCLKRFLPRFQRPYAVVGRLQPLI